MRPSPDGALCGPFSHDGEEVGLVLDGALELVVDGEVHIIGTGETLDMCRG